MQTIITGTVKRVFSKKTAYMFFAIETEQELSEEVINPQYPRSVTVSAKTANIDEEYIVEMEGEFQYKPTSNQKYHPWQFKAERIKILDDEPPARILKILCSIQGIGEKTAYAIVSRWGRNTAKLIEGEEYGNLTEISGITLEKAELIHKSWVEKKNESKIKNLLGSYGIKQHKINTIIEKYNAQQIEDDPYLLVKDGFLPFSTADRIGYDLGVAYYDDKRVSAFICHVIDVVAAGNGHTFLPFDELVATTVKLLSNNGIMEEMRGEFSEAYIRQLIGDMCWEHKLVNEEGNIYRPIRYKNEQYVAKTIANRTKGMSRYQNVPQELVEKTLKNTEEELGVSLAEKQREAVLKSVKSLTSIITGGPGVGKTTCLKALLKTFDKLAVEIGRPTPKKVLAAPSGMAAKRMTESTGLPASTIHRMLDFKPYGNGELDCKNESNPIDADIIVLDETSMLDIDLMALVLRAVKSSTTLVFVGDTDQLPSVQPGNVLHDLIASNAIPTIKLCQIFRQGEQSPILENSHRVNRGETNLYLGNKDFRFFEAPPTLNTEQIEEWTCKTVQRIFYEEYMLNGQDISKVQVLTPMRKKSERNNAKTVSSVLNNLLQSTVNPCIDPKCDVVYGATKYRKGDKVMQLTNNYEKGVFNGDVGIVLSVSPQGQKMLLDFQGEKVEYEKEEVTEQLQLAYSTTIHKSQGSEYEVVIIPITMLSKPLLQKNLLYTAISRSRRRCYLVGVWSAIGYCITNTSKQIRYSLLSSRITQALSEE